MPINRYLLQKDKAFTKALAKYFRDSQKRIANFLIRQDKEKGFSEDLDAILTSIIVGTAEFVSKRSKEILIKGSKETAKYNPKFAINFKLRNDPAVRYLDNLIKIHSSNVINGSIGHTTYTRVIKLIRKGVNDGLSYTEIAKDMTKLDGLVFSEGRAKSIAVSELGSAYEYGKYLPMQDLQNQGEIVLKKWSTVNDEKVRPTHTQNEDDGYIPLDIRFSGTGDLIAPSPPNCRCSVIYKLI